jgi:hypothetical protein
MCEFSIRFNSSGEKYQFIFNTNADLSGETRKELAEVDINMTDDEIKGSIEISLKYLLSRTI